MKKITMISVLASLLLVSTQVSARKVYVRLNSDAQAWNAVTQDDNNVVLTLPAGSNDFTANVVPNLLSGDEVWVAKGTYVLSDMFTTTGISVYGGFAGTETSLGQRTLSDKDQNDLIEPWEFTNETNFRGSGNEAANVKEYRLFDAKAVLDGITISDHYFSTAGNLYAAGVFLRLDATLRNCILRDLTAKTQGSGQGKGGGCYVEYGQVENCLFDNCLLIGDDPTVSRVCYGGAICIIGAKDTDTPTGYVKNSVIRNSRAGEGSQSGRGGAIFGSKGAIIENCVIYNNYACNSGAAIFFHAEGESETGANHIKRVINCTIANNFSPANPFIADCRYVEIYNTVFYGNSKSAMPLGDGSSYYWTIRLNNTDGSTWPFLDGIAHTGQGVGETLQAIQGYGSIMNPAFSPIFVGGAYNDPRTDNLPRFKRATVWPGAAEYPEDLDDIRKANWTVLEGSPLINAGVNAPTNMLPNVGNATLPAAFSGKDPFGGNRVGTYDIGAYEYGVVYGSSIGVQPQASSISVAAANGIINIKGLSETPASIAVYNTGGALITSIYTKVDDVTIPVYGKGVYVVNIKSSNYAYNQKVIVF